MKNVKKKWKFAGGYAFIDMKGKRGWSKTNPTVTSNRNTNKRTSTKKRSTVKTVKRRRYTQKRKRPKRDNRVPIIAAAGIGVALSKPIQNAIAGDYGGALAELGSRFTGYNYQSNTFDWKYAIIHGYLPIVAGALGSKLATKIGANRVMKKIPMLGNYIKL